VQRDRRRPRPADFRAVAPFAGAGILSILLVLAPPAPAPSRELVGTLVLTALIGLAILAMGARRGRGWTEALPALAFLLVVGLVRDTQGGAGAGFAALALLPVMWLALHGTGAQLAASLAGGALVLLAPIWLVGAPAYPLASWRPAAQWLVVAALLGVAVQRLVREAREHARTVSAQADALRANDEKTRAMLDDLNEVVFQTDSRGRLTFLNRAWTTLTGADVAASLGRPLQEFVHPVDQRRNRASFRALARTGGGSFLDEIRIVARDAGVRWVEVRAQLTLDADGRLLGTAGTMRDVTETREAQELAEARRLELERAASVLTTANETLASRNHDVEAFAALQRDFVATSSHELRTPLTAILGYLELVLEAEEDALAEAERGHLQVVYRSSQRLLALVEDLLTVNRVDTGTLAISPAPTAVDELLRAAHDAFAARCVAKGIELVVEPADALRVLVDRPRMDQVLANLVDNAAKFTPSGGTVRLAARAEGKLVRIEVADTGPGIAPHELQSVFERFFRSARAQADAVPGTGLGLPIARALVEAQDGSLTVQSTLGAGTSFTITLPLHAEVPWLASSSSTTIPTS
jgi:PAS domain S-box-containing protein